MTSDDTPQTVASEAVGQQLKQAREKRGLSISHIADAQHLRNGIIQAIENGDYSQIDSELFLKGYVRAYASQVGLDADSIIADLNAELEPLRLRKARELEANPLVDIERRRRRKRRIAKVFLLVVTLVLVTALVVTFVIPRFNSGDVSIGASTPSDTASEPLESSQPEASETLAAPGNKDSGDNAIEGEPEPASIAQTHDLTEENEIAGISSEELAEPVEAEVASTPLAAEEVLADDRIPTVSQSADPAIAASLVNDEVDRVSGRLEIEFGGDCWVQVSDASGNRLASSLKRAGERLEVSGKAPLKVVIGAVDTVDAIRFEGEPVDIRDFPVVNNRSEFTLTI